MAEMAATVKTAVSLRKDLFDRAEAVAGQMCVPRSRLFSLALESFLERRERLRILDRLDAACSGEATPEERDLAGAMLLHQRRFLRKRR
jgi:metal-responsive CopG/Arc/MetJ family transcriptional regulator